MWQSSQTSVVRTWVGLLPVASVPLWQEPQLPITWVWSTAVTGAKTTVLWQSSQTSVVCTCVGFLPIASVPL
ncbi:MAG: hypothetical protein DRR15_09295 [Gammaproteobacteria bacterium]|nr:MAG: hypothetical protein DRQ63_02935 [Gammaproteobacteria bacterium]RLA34220.1 MAG: hypothetical protein DRR15_09295 [Gammaproteobacteria bacterium]